MKINYHLLTIFRIQPHSKQQTKQPTHNNRPKRFLLKASSYLSIGHHHQGCFENVFLSHLYHMWQKYLWLDFLSILECDDEFLCMLLISFILFANDVVIIFSSYNIDAVWKSNRFFFVYYAIVLSLYDDYSLLDMYHNS